MEPKTLSAMEDLAAPPSAQTADDHYHLQALQREAGLLLGGTATGIKDAVVDAVHHPADTGVKLGTSALVGAGLALAQGRAGLLREGAEIVGLSLATSFGLDVAGRTGQVSQAMADTWRSDKNYDTNKAVVAATLGPLAVDTAIMSAGGIAGAKIGRNPSVFIGAHRAIDRLTGNKAATQEFFLQEEMLYYHPATAYHQNRVGALSLLIAKEMKLPPGTVEVAYRAGAMHDIGKLTVPLDILNYTGNVLPPAERAVVNGHAAATGEILGKEVNYPSRLADVPAKAALHHERVDGKGYPYNLTGGEIPIEARINSVADVFDVLTHQRSYKQPDPVSHVLEVMDKGRGKQFDPQVVDALMKIRADRVTKLMMSDGGHVPMPGITRQFKPAKLGELLEAAQSPYRFTAGHVTKPMVTIFDIFYGPDHISPYSPPPDAIQHRLPSVHI